MRRSSVASPALVASLAVPSADSPTAAERPLSSFECRAVAALLALQVVLRVGLATRQRFNSDEPQHFEVALGWTRGWLPYRDVFDNHTPLFHLLLSPLVAAFGEHPDALVWARWAMIPLAALSLAALYRLGAALYSRRVGAWSAALAGLIPSFLTTSLEFRADDLWLALWLAALATAVNAVPRRPRFLLVGALVGATFAASIKTLGLLSTLIGGVAAAAVLDPRRSLRQACGQLLPAAALSAAGMIGVLALLAAFLAYLGLAREFVECVLLHNLTSASLWGHRALRIVLVTAALPGLLLVARRTFDRPRRAFARASLMLATGFYLLALNGFFPLITRQDWMPFYALLTVFVVGGAIASEEWRRSASIARWLLLVAALGIAATIYVDRPWRDATRVRRALVADVLHLTRPTDYVMDVKGEMLFRRRAYYPMLEDITLARIAKGEIPDDIAQRLVATRTYVAANDDERFPPAGRQFLLDNYLPVGTLRVAGKLLEVDAAGHSAFTLALRGRYVVLAPEGATVGTLDGQPMTGPRVLEIGAHVVDGAVPALPLALLWAEAAERGLSPFHPGGPP
jgi:Dolichyl-phosphate-mannose-protein mannosyltransferase